VCSFSYKFIPTPFTSLSCSLPLFPFPISLSLSQPTPSSILAKNKRWVSFKTLSFIQIPHLSSHRTPF